MTAVELALLEKRRHEALAAAAHLVATTYDRRSGPQGLHLYDEDAGVFVDSLRQCRDALDRLGLLDRYRDEKRRLSLRDTKRIRTMPSGPDPGSHPSGKDKT